MRITQYSRSLYTTPGYPAARVPDAPIPNSSSSKNVVRLSVVPAEQPHSLPARVVRRDYWSNVEKEEEEEVGI